MTSIRIGTITAEIEYKRVKTLRMTVYPPDGRVCISAPMHTPNEVIRSFVESKQQWIEKYREKFRRSVKAVDKLKKGETHYVWGVAYNLELVEKAGRAKISLQDTVLKMQIPPGSSKAKKQDLLDKWYHRLTQEAAPPLVKKWENKTGIAIKKIFYRKMKTHWGSCNSQSHTIRLNTELAKKEPVYLEYVIVHEMIHVTEPSHNRNFYRLMGSYFPDWKVLRQKMRRGE